jgi:aminoglycoside 3-N-acetyltransferase I
MSTMQIKRLIPDDCALAISVFSMMASVFREDADTLSADYVTRLLSRNDFCALTALEDGKPIGGLIAFILPLTRSELAELFIYDIAVQQAHQRRGIGRQLVDTVRGLAAEAGITTAWVPAENDDVEAHAFYRAIGGAPTPVTIFTFQRDDPAPCEIA